MQCVAKGLKGHTQVLVNDEVSVLTHVVLDCFPLMIH